jgi:hypothetical protein
MAIPIANVLSHWQHYFQNFNMSSDAFYSQVEKVLSTQQMPNTKILRAKHKEGGMFSASREYLRIQHADLVFDICAAPFGKNFFVSWWLYETESTMQSFLKSTKVGDYMRERAGRRSFFEIDGESMFRECVHQALMESLDSIAAEKGFKLTDTERQIKELAA